MTLIQGLILGAIQGIAEWLPISSQGITTLILINLFGLHFRESLFLAIWLHLGTLLAAVYYFRNELYEILRFLPTYVREIKQTHNTAQGRLTTFLILGTVISAAIGGPLILFSLDKFAINSSLLTLTIGVFLILTGLIQRFAIRLQNITAKTLRIKDGLWIGFAQALSVFPGFSRSGLTVSSMLFLRYSNEQALRYSFILSIPIVFIAEVGLGLINGVSINDVSIAGLLSSAIFGFLTIKYLMKFALVVPSWIFCIALGLLSFTPWLLGL